MLPAPGRPSAKFVLVTAVFASSTLVFDTRAEPSSDPCKDSQECRNDGQCSTDPVTRNCVAASDAGCRSARVCTASGACSARNGRCELGSSHGCRQLSECNGDGRCVWSPGEKRCIAASPADCRATAACRTLGFCTPIKGACVAAGSDCANAEVCKSSLECTAVGGVCEIASTLDCRKTGPCKESGLCSWAARSKRCVAAGDADCRGSSTCQESGNCTAVFGECKLASSFGCSRREQCREMAECTFDSAHFKPVDGPNDDALARLASGLGESGGRVSGAGSKACVRRTGADCRLAKGCKSDGLCSLHLGDCRAVTNADCRMSSRCKDNGHCTASEGACRAATDGDCRMSLSCKDDGRCSATGGSCFMSDTALDLGDWAGKYAWADKRASLFDGLGAVEFEVRTDGNGRFSATMDDARGRAFQWEGTVHAVVVDRGLNVSVIAEDAEASFTFDVGNLVRLERGAGGTITTKWRSKKWPIPCASGASCFRRTTPPAAPPPFASTTVSGRPKARTPPKSETRVDGF